MAKKMTAVEHSEHFAEVKDYYDNGLWNEKRVRRAVVKGWITVDEYKEITGEIYEDEYNELMAMLHPEESADESEG